MKNFVQSGEWALTVIAPTGGVVAGAIVIVGSIVGAATGSASAGAEVKIRPEGVYDLGKGSRRSAGRGRDCQGGSGYRDRGRGRNEEHRLDRRGGWR